MLYILRTIARALLLISTVFLDTYCVVGRFYSGSGSSVHLGLLQTKEVEWKHARVGVHSCLFVNEIATVEHFAPNRKKARSISRYYTTHGVCTWMRTHIQLKLRIHSHLAKLRVLKTHNIDLTKFNYPGTFQCKQKYVVCPYVYTNRNKFVYNLI